MDDLQMLTWLTMGGLGFLLITAVLGTLGGWTHHHVSRHRLIVESKRRRQEYLAGLGRR